MNTAVGATGNTAFRPRRGKVPVVYSNCAARLRLYETCMNTAGTFVDMPGSEQ